MRVDPTGLLTPIAVGNGPTGDRGWRRAVCGSSTRSTTRSSGSTRARESVTTTIPVGRSPAGVAVGAGSVWVANSGDGTVTRIDPSTDKAIATIAVGGSPQALTVADGRVWVTVDAQSIAPDRGGSRWRDAADRLLDRRRLHGSGAAPTRRLEQLLYATCAQLLNYPDKAGSGGLAADARGRAVAADPLARRQDLHVQDPPRLSLLAALEPAGHRADVQGHDRAHAEPEDATAIAAAVTSPMSSAPARTWPGRPATSRAWSPAETRSRSGCSPRPRTSSPGSRCRRSARSRPTPRSTPTGCGVIPSAGPYYVTSYTPGQGVVLVRNPNYHGSRPHHFARIELAVGISAQRAVAEIEAGTADYTHARARIAASTTLAALASRLAARYGPGSAAAARGSAAVLRQPGAPARLLRS